MQLSELDSYYDFCYSGRQNKTPKNAKIPLKNSHCEGLRRWYSLSFLIANKTIDVCTNDGGILSRNLKKILMISVKCLTDMTRHYLRGGGLGLLLIQALFCQN